MAHLCLSFDLLENCIGTGIRKAVRHARMAHKATKWPIIKILTGPVMRPDRTKLVKYKLFCERILICKSFTLVRHKQAKNYGAFARLITLASFLFPDPELGLCMQTRLLLGVPCAFVFEQSSSVFVALNLFASISLMPLISGASLFLSLVKIRFWAEKVLSQSAVWRGNNQKQSN